MRAWLFALAVLATFQPIKQVASTGELLHPTSSTSLQFYMSSSQHSNEHHTPSAATADNIPKASPSASSSPSQAAYTSSPSNTQPSTTDHDKAVPIKTSQKSQKNVDESSTQDNQSISSSTHQDVITIDDSQQQHTRTREKPDPKTLAAIEGNLLQMFGFKERPQVDRKNIVIPEAMRQLYADIMGHELDSTSLPRPGLHSQTANTVRSFPHEESAIDVRFPHTHKFRLFFNVSSIPKEELLKAAELTLNQALKTHQNSDGSTTIQPPTWSKIHVFDIVRPGVKNRREPIFLMVDTKQVRHNETTASFNLDVLPAVERWLKEPKHNHGLLVHVTTSGSKDGEEVHAPAAAAPLAHNHIRLRRSINEDDQTWAHAQPLLFTYTDDGRYKRRSIRDASRARRAPPRRAHKRKDGREMCQRRSLYIDFSDVGWTNWIVAPPGYEAYYCHGDCPFPLSDHMNSTNHAVVQTLVNSLNPNLVPKACCVPTQLTSISMLYLDDQNKVVLKNYQDMAVEGCGCR